jgi:DNA-binding NarL/FixJ family response regulator
MHATEPTKLSYDAVERALVNCLEALADLARSDGETERVDRFLDAAETFSALAKPTKPHANGPPARVDVQPLTTREFEVALLIARGLTNRQIGDELIISERTADTHVQNILGKLGIVSRAQVGGWIMARHRLSPVVLLSERRQSKARRT